MNLHSQIRILFVLAVLLAGMVKGRAQWLTQSLSLKAGWNAVYLHVDSSHDTLDGLISSDGLNPIEEVWMWAPSASVSQFVTNPQTPSQPSHWLSWVRTSSPSATLTKLPGNVACLIRSASDYTWNLKGKPVVPRYQWTSSGLNFIGFPTLPGGAAPTFDTFFTPAPELKITAEIFAYAGGLITENPVQVLDQTVTKVNRGQAFWMRSQTFNRYFGPFEVVFSGSSGVRFGDALGQVSFRIRNTADRDVTVTLQRVASEPAPSGQTPIQGQVPVLVRGPVNTSTLTYTHTELSAGPSQWTLKKQGEVGSEVEVVIGVDRQQLTGTPGQLYASILRFTDSLNYTQVDVPVTAEVSSSAGLWVGNAMISSVSHYLNKYATATNATALTNLLTRLGLEEGVDGFHYEIDPSTSRVLVFGGPDNKTGAYLRDGATKVDQGSVARPYPLRLIVHNDGAATRLLQRVYHGVGLGSTPVLATREELLLSAELARARRISAVHLPFSSGNTTWGFSGVMKAGSSMATTVETSYDDQASNPFLHTYHPDHDNLNASFNSVQPQGTESYGVRRQITLNFTAPLADFDSLTRGGATLNGNYVEIITLLGKGGPTRQFDVRGQFTLNRISDIATLTQ